MNCTLLLEKNVRNYGNTVRKLREFSPTQFWQKFRESNGFTITVWKNAMKCDHDFCAKINIFSVKSSFLIKKLLKSWFHGKFLSVIVFSSTFPHSWAVTTLVSKHLIWRNIFGRREFLVFQHRGREGKFTLTHLRESKVLLLKLLKNWFHGKNFSEREFLVFRESNVSIKEVTKELSSRKSFREST